MRESPDSRLFRLHTDWCAECLACRGWVSVANKTRSEAKRRLDQHVRSNHSVLKGVADDRPPTGRFMVRGAFYASGQGTMILGYRESGTVRSNDELVWFDGRSERHSECRGVSFIREVPMQDPPSMGVIVTNALPENIHAGTVILAFR